MTEQIPNVEVKKKLNLKNDIIFKAFFSRKGNEKYLIDFLNAILKLAFIDDSDRGKIEMAEKRNKIIKEGKIEMNYLTGDAEIRRIAELVDKWESDRASELWDAKREGKIEIAARMLEKNKSIEEIMELTGLEKEEIQKLIK